MSRDLSLLQDIIEANEKIQNYIAGLNYEMFDENTEKQDSVIRRIAIIGEAANHLSADFKAQCPDISWRKIINMRNILIHAYNDVITERIWLVASRDIPDLIERLKPLFDELNR